MSQDEIVPTNKTEGLPISQGNDVIVDTSSQILSSPVGCNNNMIIEPSNNKTKDESFEGDYIDSHIDTTNYNKYKENNVNVYVLRQRHQSIIKSIFHWGRSSNNDTTVDINCDDDDNDDADLDNSIHISLINVQPSSSSSQTSTPSSTYKRTMMSFTFSHTLLYCVMTLCLFSTFSTLLYTYLVTSQYHTYHPIFNNKFYYDCNYIQQFIPSLDITFVSIMIPTSTYNHHHHIRPPPKLSIGGGAKFYIVTKDGRSSTSSSSSDDGSNKQYDHHDDTNRRLGLDTPTLVSTTSIDQQQSYYSINQQPKTITFRNIAHHGSTTQKIYTVKTSVAIDLNIETGRKTRFPSVDERVRVYMSNWYLPPCLLKTATTTSHVKNDTTNISSDSFLEYNLKRNEEDGTQHMVFREVRTTREKKHGRLRSFVIDDSTHFDLLRHLNKDKMLACTTNTYCTDFVQYLFPAMERVATSINDTTTTNNVSDVVFMYQFSDVEKTRAYSIDMYKYTGYPNVPNFKKFRFAMSNDELERILTPTNDEDQCSISPRPVPVTIIQQQRMIQGEKIEPNSQPIVVKLTMKRHYGPLQNITKIDVEWSKKKNQAIFRGQFTGLFPNGMKVNDIRKLSPIDQCNVLHRCRLVYNSASNTTLIDAKLALPILDARKDFPQVINNIPLYGKRVTIEEMLQYKAIIMLEGNDVSTGLKWALYSNSVVMAQTPTRTSWAMEELLEPWVHYIPLNDDLSDVEEQMQWILDHDHEAQQIAYRGKLWIHDLVFHPDSEEDESLIFDEIIRRTKAHFLYNSNMKIPSTNV
jgi:hypothetical protein